MEVERIEQERSKVHVMRKMHFNRAHGPQKLRNRGGQNDCASCSGAATPLPNSFSKLPETRYQSAFLPKQNFHHCTNPNRKPRSSTGSSARACRPWRYPQGCSCFAASNTSPQQQVGRLRATTHYGQSRAEHVDVTDIVRENEAVRLLRLASREA